MSKLTTIALPTLLLISFTAQAASTIEGPRLVKAPSVPAQTKVSLLGDTKLELKLDRDLTELMVQAKNLLELEDNQDKRGVAKGEIEITGRMKRGLKEIVRLCEDSLKAKSSKKKQDALVHLLEVVDATNSNTWRSAPKVSTILHGLYYVKRLVENNPGRYNYHEAENLGPHTKGTPLDLVDPIESTFWKRPTNILRKNLYYGWGRKKLESQKLAGKICDYEEPKIGNGKNPGFDVMCGKHQYKVKLAEIHSEPFATRIFWALGFHAEPVDFVRGLKISYKIDSKNSQRRLFKEFNSRTAETTVFVELPVLKLNRQKYYDPFEYIDHAVLKTQDEFGNPQIVPGSQLKSFLLNSVEEESELDDTNYNIANEQHIDHLVLVDVAVKKRNDDLKTIGHWRWNTLEHEERREVRALAVLTGWLNNYDVRWGNNKVKIHKDKNKVRELRHSVGDLGAALGSARLTSFSHGAEINEFPWFFTEKSANLHLARGEYAKTIRFRGFRTNQKNYAFMKMTFNDARWMARLMGELSDKQIVQALVAAGFSSAEALLAYEKLANRFNVLIENLELDNELSGLTRNFPGQEEFDYDPLASQPIAVEIDHGTIHAAPDEGHIIEQGKVVQRP